jgi:3'-phosphoadenosine 5'-phosphosulfate (PAPS) 3'-phosphatase
LNHEGFGEAPDVLRGLDSLDSGFIMDELKEEDLTFWVDPLDGSSGLAEGHTEHLTCIIGVAFEKRPLLGVVHKPFADETGTFGRTFIGHPESGLFTIDNHHTQSLSKVKKSCPETTASYVEPFATNALTKERNLRPRICGSHNKNQQLMDRILHSLEPESIERVAGSGNKFVHMAEGKSDIYMNLVPGFKHWDMCGSEAIV